MGETIEATASVTGVKPSEPEFDTWLEPVPFGYRRRRANRATAIGALLALVWAGLLMNGGNAKLEDYWTVGVPLAVGLWRRYAWLNTPEVRKYATVTVTFSHAERLKLAGKSLGLGLAISAALLAAQYAMGNMKDWLLACVPVLVGAVVAVVAYLRTQTTTFTPGALKAKAWYSQNGGRGPAPPRPAAGPSKFDKFLKSAWARYSLAALCFWGAYQFAMAETPAPWWVIAAAVLFGLWLSRELSKWLIGTGIAIALAIWAFHGIAALPVSAAIIIGAIIIASAIK